MSCRLTNQNSSVHWTQANHPQANWIYAIAGLESQLLYSASMWRKISCASELRLIQNDWGGSQFQSPPKATCRRLGGAKMFWGGLKIKISSERKLQWEHQLKVLDSSKWRVTSLWSVLFTCSTSFKLAPQGGSIQPLGCCKEIVPGHPTCHPMISIWSFLSPKSCLKASVELEASKGVTPIAPVFDVFGLWLCLRLQEWQFLLPQIQAMSMPHLRCICKTRKW